MKPHDLFRLHPVFGALTGDETRELLERALTKRVGAGEIVFRKDDRGDGLYGVLSGSVLIVAGSAEGKELVLNKHLAGEFFGEVAPLDGEGRSAAAVAYETSELLFLGRTAFLDFLRQRPDSILRIVGLLCARLRRATSMVEDSIFLTVSSRLAKHLLALIEARAPCAADGRAATLHLSQRELAQVLGVSREFVGKQLGILRDAGIVELGRRRLTVRDRPGLEQVASGQAPR